jgi:hypothetical protein
LLRLDVLLFLLDRFVVDLIAPLLSVDVVPGLPDVDKQLDSLSSGCDRTF